MIPIYLQYELDKRSIGRRLRMERRIAGHTQESLAEVIGVTAKYISRVETGAAAPSLSFVIKFAEVTGCDLNYLLMGSRSVEARGSTVLSEGTNIYGGRASRLSKRDRRIYDKMMNELIEALEENNT